jgi:hypothetical protein
MSEMFAAEIDGLPEQFHPDEGGNRLRKKTATAIDRMQYEMRNNFLTALLGLLAISFIAGYFISQRYEAKKREQWAEILFRQAKDWLGERGNKAAVPVKEGLQYVHSAAKEASSRGAQYGRRLNPFYREPRRRFFGIL